MLFVVLKKFDTKDIGIKEIKNELSSINMHPEAQMSQISIDS